MNDDVRLERAELRKISSRVVGIIVGLLVVGGALGWALVRVDGAVKDVDDAVDQIHAEIERSEAERCRVTLLSREGSLEKDIRVWSRYGHEIGAPQDRIDEFIEGIREDYEALPVPADCQDQEDTTP